jgi:hypothetical protein
MLNGHIQANLLKYNSSYEQLKSTDKTLFGTILDEWLLI